MEYEQMWFRWASPGSQFSWTFLITLWPHKYSNLPLLRDCGYNSFVFIRRRIKRPNPSPQTHVFGWGLKWWNQTQKINFAVWISWSSTLVLFTINLCTQPMSYHEEIVDCVCRILELCSIRIQRAEISYFSTKNNFSQHLSQFHLGVAHFSSFGINFSVYSK